jgi:hypothetical protein
MLVSSAIVLLLISVLILFLPNVTRPDFLFGVTIDPAFRQTPEAPRIVRQFRFFVAVSAAIAIGLALATGHMEWELLQVAGFITALAIAHQRTLEHAAPPTRLVEADLAAPGEKFPGGIVAALVPAVSLSALAIWRRVTGTGCPPRSPCIGACAARTVGSPGLLSPFMAGSA